MADQGLRLLTLDGGGVRGLSSLIILQSLMASLAKNGAPPPKPCEWFDMIGGTSTGGLIAIMLGRLKMTVEECIETYLSVMDSVFIRRHIMVKGNLKLQGRYDTPALEAAIKKLVRQRLGSADALLYNPEPHACKVFVCARRKETAKLMTFTSYESDPGAYGLLRCTKIWEAARATSAAPTYFDPVAIGSLKEQFVDGGLGSNNPVDVMWKEARRASGAADLRASVACLLSLGTGKSRLTEVHDSCFKFVETMRAMLTDSDEIAMRFWQDHGRELNRGEGGMRYYRFDVDVGLDSIGLEEKQKRAEIAAATRGYLDGTAAEKVEAFEQRMVAYASQTFQLYTMSNEASRSTVVLEEEEEREDTTPDNDEEPMTFTLLTAEGRHINPLQQDYWRKLTEPSLKLYERILDEAVGSFGRVNMTQLQPHIPDGRLRAHYLPLYWSYLSSVKQSLTRGPALALLYMLHLRHATDFEAEQPSERRLRILRRMHKWVDCACGCDRRWNFAQDMGLTRSFSDLTTPCPAEKYMKSKGTWKDRWFNRKGRVVDRNNRKAWLNS